MDLYHDHQVALWAADGCIGNMWRDYAPSCSPMSILMKNESAKLPLVASWVRQLFQDELYNNWISSSSTFKIAPLWLQLHFGRWGY